jgi:monothiol glutaredoxin
MSVLARIEEHINDHNIVLFMKGNTTFPQCGFSGKVVKVLNTLGAKYFVVDVLEDQEIREGIKSFSNWPTIPQLYINGNFVGGCDIILDLYESGDLAKMIAISSEEIS